jgi:WD40 repeat protein
MFGPWHLAEMASVWLLEGHEAAVQTVTYNPATQTLASGSEDETIKIWDIQTNQCLRTLRSERPYEGMNITGIIGLTEAQKMTLTALGAIEHSDRG